jgi:serine/threonine protein kinase
VADRRSDTELDHEATTIRAARNRSSACTIARPLVALVPLREASLTRSSERRGKPKSSLGTAVVASEYDAPVTVDDRGRETSPRVLGRFRIDGPLGSGGMGDVYRAYDPVLDRAVALKVVRSIASEASAGSSPSSSDHGRPLRRVVREARAAAALSHPNTVTIFEVGVSDTDDGEVFIAMELLEGEDLRKVLERGNSSLGNKLRWLLEAARALSAAHTRGLVHRDVKPENMFVCEDGTLKLLDFGIAKRGRDATDEPPKADEGAAEGEPESMVPSSLQTELGKKVGTPRYMAPEQHAAQRTDPRTDQFAWGLVAFELLAGVHPLEEQATVERPDDLGAFPSSEERAAALVGHAPDLPRPLVDVIARALAPRQEDRFPSMDPIVAALEGAPARSPVAIAVSAPPPPLPLPEAASAPPVAAAPGAVPVDLRPPRARWRRAAIAAAVLTAGLATAAVGWRLRAKATRSSTPPLVAEGALRSNAACRLASTRTYEVVAADRMTILPDGTAFAVRGVGGPTPLRFEREVGSGFEEVKVPIAGQIPREYYDDVALGALAIRDRPYVLAELSHVAHGPFALALAVDGVDGSMARNDGPVTAVVATRFDADLLYIIARSSKKLVAGTITRKGGVVPPIPGPPASVGLEGRFRDSKKPQHILIDSGDVESVAIAAHGDRVAIAYQSAGVKLAFINEALQPLGDRIDVAPETTEPAIGFAGSSVVVFWRREAGGKMRLMTTTLRAGETQTLPARVVYEDPLGPHPPVTAELPTGEWVVAWLAAPGGQSKLRVAPIDPNGAIGTPADVPLPSQIGGIGRTTTKDGVDWYWREGSHFKVAHVSCTQP